MSKLVEEYLDHIQEGIWSAIKRALEFPPSKHPKYRVMLKMLNNRYIQCEQRNQGSETRIKLDTQWGNFNYIDYQENPDLIVCNTAAYVDFLKEFISWTSKEKPDKICKFNKNPERCKKWLENEIMEAKAEMKSNIKQLQQMKGGRMNKSAFNKFQKNLYLKGPKK